MSRGRLMGALVCAVCVFAPAVARADAPPLIVFSGPLQPGTEVVAARQALQGLARRTGTALVDLSPKPPPAPQARAALRRGIDSYLALEYDAAVKAFDAAIAEAATTGANGLRPTELSDVFLYRALALTQKGDATRAWDDFVRAAVVDPTRRLDPVRFPPRAAESFTRAIKAAQATPPTTVTVAVDAGCTAMVDARKLASSAAVSLLQGEHYVRVTCPGKHPYGARVVFRGATGSVRPSLRAVEPVGPNAAADEARKRGAAVVLFAHITTSRGVTTLGVRMLDANDARERARVVSRIDRPRGVTDIVAATQKLVDQVVKPPAPLVVVRDRPWYRRPWVWGVTGAALATAAILPFALRSDRASGFDLDLSGALP